MIVQIYLWKSGLDRDGACGVGLGAEGGEGIDMVGHQCTWQSVHLQSNAQYTGQSIYLVRNALLMRILQSSAEICINTHSNYGWWVEGYQYTGQK